MEEVSTVSLDDQQYPATSSTRVDGPPPSKRSRVEDTPVVDHDTGHLHDALPYFDKQYAEEGMKSVVDALISEELKQMPPFDKKAFDDRFPLPDVSFSKTHFTHNELERISMGEPLQPIDASRYRLEAPSGRNIRDIGAWETAIKNSRSQLQHQSLRLLNLELLVKYGPATWRQQNDMTDASVKRMEEELAAVRKEAEHINRTRKQEQVSVGTKLQQLEGEWMDLVAKNVEIETACNQLEMEIKQRGGQEMAVDT